MLCIKTVKSLSQNEKDDLNNLIDINVDDAHGIIIYYRQCKDMVACIFLEQNKELKMTKVKKLFVKDGHRNLGIGKKLLDTGKQISLYVLYICLEIGDKLQTYLENRGFRKMEVTETEKIPYNKENEIILVCGAEK